MPERRDLFEPGERVAVPSLRRSGSIVRVTSGLFDYIRPGRPRVYVVLLDETGEESLIAENMLTRLPPVGALYSA